MRTVPAARRAVLAAAFVLGLALAAVALAGCGPAEPVPPSDPTPSVSPDGGPSATPASGLAAFEARLRDATARQGLIVRALGDASGSGDPADLRLVVGQMRTWVEGERAWIAAHPSEPCFELAVATFDAALDAMDAAADAFLGTVEVSTAPSDDVTRPSIGAEAVERLQDASRALLDAAARAKTARTDCT
jgi:hypothetical protein